MAFELLPMLTTIMGSIMGASIFLQTLKIIKRKSSADVSVPTFVIFTIGAALWLIYGITLNNYPLITANTIATISSFSVIVAALKYQKKK